MKNKKLLSLLTTGALAVSMISPAMAADITMDGTATGYSAYQLLSLTTSLKGGDHSSDPNGQHTKDCYNYSYSVNETYREILAKQLGVTYAGDSATDIYDGDQEIIEKIGEMNGNPEALREFADAIFAQVKSMPADETATEKEFIDVGQGYYLIVESGTPEEGDSRSLVMLDTAGQEDITVQSKEGTPTLDKKVADTDSVNFVESVTARIGEKVTFQLTGTMPANIDNYKTYKYVFHDTLSSGLSYAGDENLSVKIDGSLVSNDKYVVSSSNLDDGCSLEISFENIKDSGIAITPDSQVVVEYKATILDTVNHNKTGNPNTAKIEFSNDPYNEDSSTTTPTDQANVFAFQLNLEKVDENGESLEGAGFILEKKNATGDFEQILEDRFADGKTSFTFDGLDVGTYRLIEADIPNGYTKARDLTFKIEATFTGDDENVAQELGTLTILDEDGEVIVDKEGHDVFTISVDNGTMGADIVNRPGVLMPTTGGIGTIGIYGGGALLLAGGIMMMLKRKKTQE